MNRTTQDPVMEKLVRLLSSKMSPQPHFSSSLLSFLIEASCYVDQAERLELRKEAATQTEENIIDNTDDTLQKEREKKRRRKRKKERNHKKRNKRQKARSPSTSTDETDSEDGVSIFEEYYRCSKDVEEDEDYVKKHKKKKKHSRVKCDSICTDKIKSNKQKSTYRSEKIVENQVLDDDTIAKNAQGIAPKLPENYEILDNETTKKGKEDINDTTEECVLMDIEDTIEGLNIDKSADANNDCKTVMPSLPWPILIQNKNMGFDRKMKNPLVDLNVEIKVNEIENCVPTVEDQSSKSEQVEVHSTCKSSNSEEEKVINSGTRTGSLKSRTRTPSTKRRNSYSRSRSRSTSADSSRTWSRSRSPSIRRRKTSPSFLDKRRITSARKLPIPYIRTASPSTTIAPIKDPITKSTGRNFRNRTRYRAGKTRNRSKTRSHSKTRRSRLRKRSRSLNRRWSRSRSGNGTKSKLRRISRSRSMDRSRSRASRRSRSRSKGRSWSRSSRRSRIRSMSKSMSRTRSRSWSRSNE